MNGVHRPVETSYKNNNRHHSNNNVCPPVKIHIPTDRQPDFQITDVHPNSNLQRYPMWKNMSKLHYNLIQSSTGILDDEIIDNAQVLIKKISPLVSGLQQVGLGAWLTFEVMTSEFIQILHTGHFHLGM